MDLFGTAGIRGSVEARVTPSVALRVGRAVGEDGSEFVVGRDGRETGDALVAAVVAGLASAGADVRRVGMVPTPALAFASRGRHGIQVTASHNPPGDNGIKVFEDGTEYDRDGEKRIERRVTTDDPPVAWDQWGSSESEYVLPAYRQAVAEYVTDRPIPDSLRTADRSSDGTDGPLDGLRVAVDCGNGMGTLATPAILGSLGASVVTLNASIDGHFPGRPSKPTPETIRDLRAFVTEGEFSLGIAHDGDADRIAVVDADGQVVHEDTVVAILAEYYVRTSEVSDPVVVTTPNASGRIDERVTASGGRVERVRLGALHEGIARVRRDGGSVVFAAEPWKHIHTGFGPWIDGVTSAALLSKLVATTDGLESLREPIVERPYRKVNIDCPDEVKERAMEAVSSRLTEEFPEAEHSNEYGLRLDFSDGSWVLVRPSGTEPYLRLYVESEDADDVVESVRSLVRVVVDDLATRH